MCWTHAGIPNSTASLPLPRLESDAHKGGWAALRDCRVVAERCNLPVTHRARNFGREATLHLTLWRARMRGITVVLLRQAPLARGTVCQDWDEKD